MSVLSRLNSRETGGTLTIPYSILAAGYGHSIIGGASPQRQTARRPSSSVCPAAHQNVVATEKRNVLRGSRSRYCGEYAFLLN
jgi:hypothetical protein